eukprot:8785667-Alexandrium_andersonii.AAC.1
MDTPRYARSEGCRSTEPLSCIVPHEALAEEIHARPDLPALLEEAKQSGALPPCYWDHPLVVAGGTTP